MSKTSTDGWFTKAEAARVLGCAEKTVDRLSDRGELSKRIQRRVGQSKIAVFNPDDVERVLRERGIGSPFPIPEVVKHQLPKMPPAGELIAAEPGQPVSTTVSYTLPTLLDELNRLVLDTVDRAQRQPLYVSMEEAAIRLGLNVSWVRRCVREGVVQARRLRVDGRMVTRVRLSDLEKV